MTKPYAPACDRNKEVLFSQLEPYLREQKQVLEIASGTGQHGVYFAEKMPDITWQMSDLAENHRGINAWVVDSQLDNVLPALTLDVNNSDWPITKAASFIFTANSLHIMAWSSVEQFFRGIKKHLKAEGLLAIYGPFNYQGQYTSASNADFDQWLKQQSVYSGIRDFEAVAALAESAALILKDDIAMPANNRLLIWQKK